MKMFPPLPFDIPPLLLSWTQVAEKRIKVEEARKAVPVDPLALTVSNPPTQAELQTIADKQDELISALKAAGLMEV